MMSPTETVATWAWAICEQERGNYWLWVHPWLVFDIIVLEEGPALKRRWWKVMMKGDDFLPLTSSYHKSVWVYCHWVDNSSKTTPVSFPTCAPITQGAFPCSSVCVGIALVEGVVLIMDAAHRGVLVMNLGIERRRQDFINEIRLGSMSSNDLISRASSG